MQNIKRWFFVGEGDDGDIYVAEATNGTLTLTRDYYGTQDVCQIQATATPPIVFKRTDKIASIKPEDIAEFIMSEYD